MIDLHPTKCNLCGGKVVYIRNDKIYGKLYGSGYCYYCTECGAYVGTHIPMQKQAMGLLANKEMRMLKVRCHSIFDNIWKHEGTFKKRRKKRRECYKRLAAALGIEENECHFGYFDIDMLLRALKVLELWNKEMGGDSDGQKDFKAISSVETRAREAGEKD